MSLIQKLQQAREAAKKAAAEAAQPETTTAANEQPTTRRPQKQQKAASPEHKQKKQVIKDLSELSVEDFPAKDEEIAAPVVQRTGKPGKKEKVQSNNTLRGIVTSRFVENGVVRNFTIVHVNDKDEMITFLAKASGYSLAVANAIGKFHYPVVEFEVAAEDRGDGKPAVATNIKIVSQDSPIGLFRTLFSQMANMVENDKIEIPEGEGQFLLLDPMNSPVEASLSRGSERAPITSLDNFCLEYGIDALNMKDLVVSENQEENAVKALEILEKIGVTYVGKLPRTAKIGYFHVVKVSK